MEMMRYREVNKAFKKTHKEWNRLMILVLVFCEWYIKYQEYNCTLKY